MRIAILSNSHAAALAHAARAAGRTERFTFFAADGGRLHGLAPEGSSLVPQNDALRAALTASAGGAPLDTTAFDAFIVYALGFMMRPLGPEYSEAVRAAALADRYHGVLGAKLVGLLAALTDKPIIVAPTPLRARLPQNAAAAPAPASHLSYAKMVEWTGTHVVPAGVHVVGQPAATIADGFFTDPSFNVDAPKLTAPGEPEKHWGVKDVNHMNAVFGALMLDVFEDAISLH